MAVTLRELTQWFDSGIAQAATHMIVVVDEFDWEDYPVYVATAEDAREVASDYNRKSMQRVMEVYILDTARRTEQLNPGIRVHNYV
jgi:hypothetical protein